MKNFIKIILITILTSFLFTNLSYSETPHYIDFSRVLNQSKAGKEAQDYLKAKFESESKKFSQEEKKLRKEKHFYDNVFCEMKEIQNKVFWDSDRCP